MTEPTTPGGLVDIGANLARAPGRNEPAHLPLVLLAVARAMGKPATTVAAETRATARRFFRLPAEALELR